MEKGTLFWVIFIVALVFYGWGWYVPPDRPYRHAWGIVVFVLLGLLGWQVFGQAVK